jgi:hypothetical protein
VTLRIGQEVLRGGNPAPALKPLQRGDGHEHLCPPLVRCASGCFALACLAELIGQPEDRLLPVRVDRSLYGRADVDVRLRDGAFEGYGSWAGHFSSPSIVVWVFTSASAMSNAS